jgi:hypothetical protein
VDAPLNTSLPSIGKANGKRQVSFIYDPNGSTSRVYSLRFVSDGGIDDGIGGGLVVGLVAQP